MDLRAMGRRLVALRIQMAGLVVTYFILHPSILFINCLIFKNISHIYISINT